MPMDGGGGAEEGEPLLDVPAGAALGSGAIHTTAICDSSSSPSPPPSPSSVGFTMEEAGAEAWQSPEERRKYLAMEAKKLAQQERLFEEQGRAKPDDYWAKLWENTRLLEIERRKVDEEEAKYHRDKERFEQERRRYEQRRLKDLAKLEEEEAKYQRDRERFEQEKRQFEQQVLEHAKLDEEEAKQLEELNRIKRDLLIQKEALQKRLAEKEQLQNSLLGRHEHNNNNNDDTWNLEHIVTALVLASGLLLFVQIQTLFGLVYHKHIVDALTVIWAFGCVVLSIRVFERFGEKNSFSHHVARLVYLCFVVFGIYALYLISNHVDGTSSGASLSS